MKTLLSIISIGSLLLSCNQSFETKLIDESYTQQESEDKNKEGHDSKTNINAVTIANSWFLDFNTERKNSAITPFQNIVINDSIDNYYVTLINSERVLIEKKEVKINLTSKVVLSELEIYSKPELTKRTTLTYKPGTILLLSSNSLNNFHQVKLPGDKQWYFLRKKENQLSGIEADLTLANDIMEINKNNEDEFVKDKLYDELRQKEDFNRPEWLPHKEETSDFNDDEPML